MYSGYIPGVGFGVPGEKGATGATGATGAAGSNGSNGSNGFVLLGSGSASGTVTSFNVSLSSAITPNKAVLIVADLEIAGSNNPDFQIYPSGATLANYTYRFWGGVNVGTGTQPRVARVASLGASGMRINIEGVLTLDEDGRLFWNGKYVNSTLAQYNISNYYGTSETQSSISTLVFDSTISNSLASGSKASVFQLW